MIASIFSPDWDSAANDLNKAAVCFKVKYDKILLQTSAVREARARVWSYVLWGVIAYDRETEHRTGLGVHQVWYGEVTMRYPAAYVDAA